MSFRIWIKGLQTDLDFPATVAYSLGNGTFGNGVYSRLSRINTTKEVSQSVACQPGWSWICINITPANLDMSQVMSSLDKLMIAINGDGQFYLPGVVNNIGQYAVTQGYKVYLNSVDTLRVSGLPVTSSTAVPLSAGWHLISYLPSKAMSVESALTSIRAKLAIAKNARGGYYIPGTDRKSVV